MRNQIFAASFLFSIFFIISCSGMNDATKGTIFNNMSASSLLKSPDQTIIQPDGPTKYLSGNTLFSNDVVKDINSITSENEFLYLAARYEIIEYNSKSNKRRTLTGNLSLPNDGTHPEVPILEWPRNLIKSGEYIYYCEDDKIQKVYTGKDNKSAIDTVVTPKALARSGANLLSFACNDESVFWAAGSDDFSHIYKKGLTGDSIPVKILTVGGKSRLTACDNILYISSGIDNTLAAPRLYAYDIENKNLTVLQNNMTLNQYHDIPVVCGPASVFWMNGDSLYGSEYSTGAAESLFSGLSDIIQLAANDASVFALQRMPSGASCNIIELELTEKKSRTLYSGQEIRGISCHNNILYWTSADKIFQLNPNGLVSELIAGGASFPIGGIEAIAQNKIMLSDKSGSILICQDLQTKLYNLVTPVGMSLSSVYANSKEFFLFGYNHGIRRIPANPDFRLPVTVKDGLCGIEKIFIKDKYLYWSEHSSSCELFRISRIRTDGSGYEILSDMDGSNLMRGLVLLNDKLYFTYRPELTSPWCLVSISLDGEHAATEYSLGFGPVSLTERNGIFYVADTLDKINHAIYSINLTEKKHSELISGLPDHYVSDEYADLYTIYASDRYIYYKSYLDYLKNDYRIKSREILSWNNLGDPEIIEDSSPRAGNQFYGNSNYFYYPFTDGLRYINE
jgi:hypothetical protein